MYTVSRAGVCQWSIHITVKCTTSSYEFRNLVNEGKNAQYWWTTFIRISFMLHPTLMKKVSFPADVSDNFTHSKWWRERCISNQWEIQQWEYDHINSPGCADILIYEFTSSDLHDLRNIIKYALLQTFPMMLMDAETFGKCQVLSFLYCWWTCP